VVAPAGRFRDGHAREARSLGFSVIGRGRGLSLRRRVTTGDRQPKYVGDRARVTVGHGTGQPGDLRRQHGFGRDDAPEPGQPAFVLALLDAIEDEPGDVLPRERHRDPGTRDGHCRHRHGNHVVERTVQVRERDVDEYARHRPFVCGRLGRAPGPASW
jgi:hypothetical protein